MSTRPDGDMPRHGAYILRLWETRSVPPDPTSSWRLSLEDVHTGEKHKFPDVEGLSSFLRARMAAEDSTIESVPEAEGEALREAEPEGALLERQPDVEIARASILLVEEDETLRQRLRRWLDATVPGAAISEADSGETAVSSVRSAPPDVILVDLAGSGDSNLEIIRRLRSAAPSARIIALGSKEEEAYEDRVCAAGANDYLQMWKIREALRPALQDQFAARRKQARERTVVCIEDEPDVISLIKLVLEHHRVKLIGALGGRDGLEKVRQVKPDLVLLDIMMPDVNGAEVLRQIKADEHLRDIPIIVITVLDPRYTAEQGVDFERIDGFIRKPFVPRELVETVNSALQLVA